MGISSLVTYTKLLPYCTSPRNHEIDTITIHCTGGQGSAKSIGNVLESRKVSANYGIGTDGDIGGFVDENDRAWSTGGKDKLGNPILVNGISGSDNDHRAITIEVASDSFAPYAVTDKAYTSLINLCADICKRNGIEELKWKADKLLVGQIDKQNMTVHRWFAYKACPGDYLYDRHAEIAKFVNQKLKPVIIVPPPVINNQTGDDNMTVEDFLKLWGQARKTLQDNDCSKWSEQARKWAIDTGLVQGGSTGVTNYMWEDVLNREQMITLLFRFAQMLGKA